MLLFLKNVNDDDKVFYLAGKSQFLVGRRDCDFLIQDDQSISRKHAILRLKGITITVEDCGSKYKTLYKGEAMQPNTEMELAVGDSVQFGVSHSLYRLQKYDFVTTGTCLNGDVKTKLISDLSIIKGKYVEQWTSDCTHLTMEQITLTIKFLQALIDEKPVVKPAYWSKFGERVQKNLPPPNIDRYNKPPVGEVLLNKIDLTPNPLRKQLFKGKLFVFPKEKDRKRLEDIIKKAGGTSISWEKNPVPLEDIAKSPKEFLVIQTTDTINDPNLNLVIKKFAEQGKRTIPLKEVATAVAHCSCERDCNPSFDRIEQVFPSRGPAEPSQSSALAANTESEQFTIRDFKTEERTPLVIPDTERKLNDSESCNIFTEMEIEEKGQSAKRTGDDKLEGAPSKKIKIDNDDGDVKKEEDKVRIVHRLPGTINGKETVTNPSTFLNKNKSNKMELSGSSKHHPFKRTKKESDTAAEISQKNPFLLSLGNKKRTSDDVSEPSVSKKRKGGKDNIFSSTKIENVSHSVLASSRISRINKDMMNNPWMSKNVTDEIVIEKEEKGDFFDVEMKKFAEQFKDTVIVEIMGKIPPKQKILRVHSDNASKGKVNFKVFRKVLPLKPQKIIGKISFTVVSAGKTTEIADSKREAYSDSDDETEDTMKAKKKKPKKFVI